LEKPTEGSQASYPFEKFDPRRWLTHDADGNEVFDKNAIPSITFGGGFRGCFGKKLAMLELRIVVTVLVLRFEFLSVPDELRSMDVDERIFRAPTMAYANLRSM